MVYEFTFEGIMKAAMISILSEKCKKTQKIENAEISLAWERFLYSECNDLTAARWAIDFDWISRWKDALSDFLPEYSQENAKKLFEIGVEIAIKLIKNAIEKSNLFTESYSKVDEFSLDDNTMIYIVKEENFPYWECNDVDSGAEFIVMKIKNGYLVRRSELDKFYPYAWTFYDSDMLNKVVNNLPKKLSASEAEELEQYFGCNLRGEEKITAKISEFPGAIEVNSIQAALTIIKNLK